MVALAAAVLAIVDQAPARGGEDVLKYSGIIAEVNADGFTIDSADGLRTAFQVAGSTVIALDDGTPLSLADLYGGAEVLVTARQDGDALNALTVSVLSGHASCAVVEPEPEPTAAPETEETVTPDATAEVSRGPSSDPDETSAGFYIEGVISALTADSVEVDMRREVARFSVDAGTAVTHQDGSEASLADLAVEQYIAAWGTIEGETWLATGIQVFDGEVEIDPDYDPCRFEVTGTVFSMEDGRLLLSSGGYLMDFAVDADTVITSPEQSPPAAGTIADLTPGAAVTVEGEYAADGLRAASITVLDTADGGLLLTGSVLEASAESLAIDAGLATVAFVLTAETEVVRDDGEQMTVSEVTVGDYVTVASASTVNPVASEITVITLRDAVYETTTRADGLSGTVKSITRNGRSMELRRRGGQVTRISLGRGTWISHADGTRARANDIARGVHIEVEGAETDGHLSAAVVRMFDERQDVGIVRRLAATDGGLRFVLLSAGRHRRAITVTETAVLRFQDGRRATLRDLRTGVVALVKAVGTRGRWKANQVILLDGRLSILRLETGVIESSRQAIRLRAGAGPLRVAVRADTTVARANGRPIEARALKKGARVFVAGYRTDGRRIATFVRLLPRAAP